MKALLPVLPAILVGGLATETTALGLRPKTLAITALDRYAGVTEILVPASQHQTAITDAKPEPCPKM